MTFKVYGVVHLKAMPGDLDARPFDAVLEAASADAKALVDGGVDGFIIENFGSTPFYKGTADDPMPPHQVAMMARVCTELRRNHPNALIGVNCLRNDARAAIGVAAACGSDFVRINIHSGAYVTDQGVIEGEAAHTLRYRQSLDSSIRIFADVLVKHASPLGEVDLKQTVKDTVLRGRADAVIVTGSGTGAPTSVSRVADVKSAAGNAAVLIGSGFNPDNAESLMKHADGAIVGTYFKEDGDVANPVMTSRVKTLMKLVKARR